MSTVIGDDKLFIELDVKRAVMLADPTGQHAEQLYKAIDNYVEYVRATAETEHPINKTLHNICRLVASGEIPAEIYNKYLGSENIGFKTPLEIMAIIRGEQIGRR